MVIGKRVQSSSFYPKFILIALIIVPIIVLEFSFVAACPYLCINCHLSVAKIIECVGEVSTMASIPFLQTCNISLHLQRKGYIHSMDLMVRIPSLYAVASVSEPFYVKSLN